MNTTSARTHGTFARWLGGAAALAFALALGCAGTRPLQARKPEPPKPSAAQLAEEKEAREQREAQHVWCDYLQALYLRAAGEGPSRWPRYGQCLEVKTMGAPQLVRRTAECAMRALQRFQGDPFTQEYSDQVGKCGAEALQSIVVTPAEMAPILSAICGHISSCGDMTYSDCRDALQSRLGPHLERAVGAMNSRGRTQLRTCLKTMTCEDLGQQITACLEPIMDDLLWMPS